MPKDIVPDHRRGKLLCRRSRSVDDDPQRKGPLTQLGSASSGKLRANAPAQLSDGYGFLANVTPRMRPTIPGGGAAPSRIAIGPENDSPEHHKGPVHRHGLPYQRLELRIPQRPIRRIGDNLRVETRRECRRKPAKQYARAIQAWQQDESGG